MSVIEKGSTVLVTGVNGFIASHVADQLLEAGYKVKGTARSADKAKWLEELFDKKYGKEKYETVVVADMIEDGAFDEAVKGKPIMSTFSLALYMLTSIQASVVYVISPVS